VRHLHVEHEPLIRHCLEDLHSRTREHVS
jgi:hypothetical protein